MGLTKDILATLMRAFVGVVIVLGTASTATAQWSQVVAPLGK